MSSKNPSEFYDLDYLKTPIRWAGGATRYEDNGSFYQAARFIDSFLAEQRAVNPSIVDVGCGRGFVVSHLNSMGRQATGCEYGTAALAHSVCAAVFGDLTERLPYNDATFDFIACTGVLSHLPADKVPHGLQELSRIGRRWLWTNILVVEQGESPEAEQAHHRNIISRRWWRERFQLAGWREVECATLKRFFDVERDHCQWMTLWNKS